MKHLAIMPDGNRRWAKANGESKSFTYLYAADRFEKTCEWAIQNEIPILTYHVFTNQNWKRSPQEIEAIMDAIHTHFVTHGEWYVSAGVRLIVRGRRDRAEKRIIDDIEEMEQKTKDCKKLTVYLAFDYSGREEIIDAINKGARTEEEISALLIPEPDMIIRTGGNHRLSGFLLWQAAYSELYFIDKMFPDLSLRDLDDALVWFNSQTRNFGK